MMATATKPITVGGVIALEPIIVPPRIRVPSTPSTLLSFLVKFVLYLSCKRTKIKQKEAILAQLKNNYHYD